MVKYRCNVLVCWILLKKLGIEHQDNPNYLQCLLIDSIIEAQDYNMDLPLNQIENIQK